VSADLYGLADVTLLGRHGVDADEAVSVVAPVDKRGEPEGKSCLGKGRPGWAG